MMTLYGRFVIAATALGLSLVFSPAVNAIPAPDLQNLRQAHTMWAPIEAGAAVIDMRAHTTDGKAPDEDNIDPKWMSSVVTTLPGFIKNARIAPGTYKLTNCWRTDYPDGKCSLGPDSPYILSIAKTPTIDFLLTAEHIALLHHGNIRGLGFDVKRPYGDMTYYYIDIADAIKMPVQRGEGGKMIFTKTQLEKLDKLHGEMLFALQALLQYGQLD